MSKLQRNPTFLKGLRSTEVKSFNFPLANLRLTLILFVIRENTLLIY